MGRLAILVLAVFWGIVTLGSLVWEVADPASVSTENRPQALPPGLTGKAEDMAVPSAQAVAPEEAIEPTLAELSPGLRASLRATIAEKNASNPRQRAMATTPGTPGRTPPTVQAADQLPAEKAAAAAKPSDMAAIMRPRPRPAQPATVADATASGTAKASLGAIKPPAARPKAPVAEKRGEPRIAEAQALLAGLGYPIGALDGRMGPQTQAAIKAFEKKSGLKVDGRVDDQLLARLHADVGSSLREEEKRAVTPARALAPSQSLAGRVLGGMQRLIGHDFNSVTAPERVTAYCDEHGDEWIYDRGVDRMRACVELVGKPKVAYRPLPGDR